MKKLVLLSLFAILALFCSACTKSSSDDDDGDIDAGEGEFATECGVVLNGKLKNPVAEEDGIKGVIKSAADGNTIILSTAAGEILIKLHALNSAPSSLKRAANNFIMQNASNSVSFFKATDDCRVAVPGGTATSGQIITANGTSLSENLINTGLINSFDKNGDCREDLIADCYKALNESVPVNVKGAIRDFLWKPEGDPHGSGAGRLVILTDVCNADVVVNGEHLTNTGASNGCCSTCRGTKSGCAYGSNVKVEVFSRDGGIYLFPDANPYYIIPNGCNRVEFKN